MFMKLAKLLGAGSSFFGGGKTVAYRLSRGGSLPKFNEGKNPFAPKLAEAATASPQEPGAAPATAPAPKAPAVSAFKPAAEPVSPPAAPPEPKVARTGWTMRLNPFRAPAPAPAPAPSAIQTELSLDAVKVLHNDLADADVEVVPVKARAEAPPMPPPLPPARQAWEYLGENILKAR
jgi:hypothetical protein